MRGIFALAALAVLPCAAADLFNHKDFSGWELLPTEGKPPFVVENGVMHTTGFHGNAIYTKEKIGNATIHVVYKMSNPKGNSGVFIRIPSLTKKEMDLIDKGIEVQIDDRDNEWHCTGVLYSMTRARARASKPAGEWNTMDITLDGLRTVVRVNGQLVTDYDGVSPVPPRKMEWEPARGPRPAFGYIAVQAHDPSAVIMFKDISVEPLKK